VRRPDLHRPSGIGVRFARAVFLIIWLIACRFTPPQFHAWRRLVLRLFGAEIGAEAHVYPSVKIWAPWNLRMEKGSCLARGVDCYNVDNVSLGAGAIVSQRAYLCTASHDFNDGEFPLVTAPISIGRSAWVCTEAFVGPGVAVGEHAVVGARAVVTKNVPPKAIVVGNPGRLLEKKRVV
jgi:putative colanic acid biosynthesis acetyltransferase WcaF